jgi:CheY-like chemotaxis protein
MSNNPERRMRVLIVDDEPIIAMDMEMLILEAGYEIAGIVGKIEKALSFVEGDDFDVAILDANLGGTNSAPVANALSARGMPFVVVSGYEADQQHAALRAAPCLQKPVSSSQLIETLKRVVEATEI